MVASSHGLVMMMRSREFVIMDMSREVVMSRENVSSNETTLPSVK